MAASGSSDGQMLCEAVVLEDPGEALEMTESLLDSGIDPDGRGWDGLNALARAAEAQRWEIVRRLLDRGAVCDNEGIGWQNPLFATAVEGPLDVLATLLSQSDWLSMTQKHHEGERSIEDHPISALVERGRFERLEQLWTLGIDVLLEVFSVDLGWTPLIDAAQRGDMDGIRWLLNRKADVNAHAEFCIGKTALEAAIDEGHEEAVRWLLGAGANPNIPTWMWRTGAERAIKTAQEDPSDEAVRIRDMVLAAAKRFGPPQYPDGRTPDVWPPSPA